MSNEQKKNRIVERAVRFTGLGQSVAAELAHDAKELSIRRLRRIIGLIQRDGAAGLQVLHAMVTSRHAPGPKVRVKPLGP
jgi:hypothetical protein